MTSSFPSNTVPDNEAASQLKQNGDIVRSFERSKQSVLGLPTEKGMMSDRIYQYQGFWYHLHHILGVMAVQQHFKARPSDIFLVSFPKSGTIWFKALLFAIVNRTRYHTSTHPLLTTNPHTCVPFLELQLFREPPFVDTENIPSPRLFGTHIPFGSLPNSIKSSSSRIIYVCRNPKDVFVSMWHFFSNLRAENFSPVPFEEAFEMFSQGKSGYGPFWDHMNEYKKASLDWPDKVFFITYEEMKRDAVASMKRMAEFLECPFSVEEVNEGVIEDIINLCSFQKLSNLEVNKSMKSFHGGDTNYVFLRKGEVGDWKNYLSPQMIECMDKITEEKLGIFHQLILEP